MYHGIVLDKEFKDQKFPETLKLFAKRKSVTNDWILYGIKIADNEIDQTINKIQENMRNDEPYYAHLYDEDKVIVLFKNKTFMITPHISSWAPPIEYGKTLGIPETQLDFWPNRFQDEVHYFKKEDFI